ncbi:MAG: type II toxin-antitoxin system RelE/ParE family toxin [Snowella sp.]|nr:type II toxin-antitoxin system RelE/ParE family toxin [Snowella sp.]
MYQISLRRRAIKDLANLPDNYPNLVGQHINKLADNPRPQDSKKLKGDSGYSLRVGVYRVLYDIDDSYQKVTIYQIKHRREAYK